LFTTSNSATSSQYGMVNFGPLTSEIGWWVWGIPTDFASWLRYCTDVAQQRSTKLCMMFGHLLGWYTIYTFYAGCCPYGILPAVKFTSLCIHLLAFSYIGSVTAQHSSSGR